MHNFALCSYNVSTMTKVNACLNIVLFVCGILFISCQKTIPDENSNSYANSPKALEYCKEHKRELLSDIFQRMAKDEARTDPIVNNPDITREVLIRIGYDGLNVQGFLAAGAYLDSLVVDSLIRKAVACNNKTALLISGSSASGKSTALKTIPHLKTIRKSVGFSSDQTFESVATLTKMIGLLKNNGFAEKDITIVLVYCDAPTSFFSACGRLYRTGRAISKEYFTDIMYPSFVGRVVTLYRETGAEHPLIFLDNAKFALSATTDENGQVVGYSGADAPIINTWVYYNALAADAFTSVSNGAKRIMSESELPKAQKPTTTSSAHWYYEMGNSLSEEILNIVSVWTQGGDKPYKYTQEHMPWFAWSYDFYVHQTPESQTSDKPDGTNIDWNLYPTDGVSSPFYSVRNPEKAKKAMLENLSE